MSLTCFRISNSFNKNPIIHPFMDAKVWIPLRYCKIFYLIFFWLLSNSRQQPLVHPVNNQ